MHHDRDNDVDDKRTTAILNRYDNVLRAQHGVRSQLSERRYAVSPRDWSIDIAWCLADCGTVGEIIMRAHLQAPVDSFRARFDYIGPQLGLSEFEAGLMYRFAVGMFIDLIDDRGIPDDYTPKEYLAAA